MTPAQLTALEALAGRTLTQSEQDAITPLVASGSTQAIADILSVGRTRLVSGTITTRGAAAAFPALGGLPGSLAFEAAMLALETFAAANVDSADIATKLTARGVRRQLAGFQELGLDFSVAALRGMLDQLAAASVLTTAQASGFKGLAPVVADPITHTQVGAALTEAA